MTGRMRRIPPPPLSPFSPPPSFPGAWCVLAQATKSPSKSNALTCRTRKCLALGRVGAALTCYAPVCWLAVRCAWFAPVHWLLCAAPRCVVGCAGRLLGWRTGAGIYWVALAARYHERGSRHCYKLYQIDNRHKEHMTGRMARLLGCA